MGKEGKSRLSIILDGLGILLIVVSIIGVKATPNPIIETILGVVITVGFACLVVAKYV